MSESTPTSTPSKDGLIARLRARGLERRAHLALGLVGPLLLTTWNMWRVRRFTIDDAYISYRYAENFAYGLGLVFNEGEYIEGYTNFLWTFLLGIGVWMDADPDVMAKAMGALSALGAVAVVYVLSWRLVPDRKLPSIAPWLLASAASFTGYAVFGLETVFFVFLVLFGALLFIDEEAGRRRWPLSGLVFALAGLTRPEAPMFLGIMMIFLGGRGLLPLEKWAPVLGGRDADASRITRLSVAIFTLAFLGYARAIWPLQEWMKGVGWILLVGAVLILVASLPRAMFGARNWIRGMLFVVPVASHFIWRHAYYGRWLPNTLGAKTGDTEQQMRKGARYLLDYLHHEGAVIYLAILGIAVALAWRHRAALAFAVTSLLVGLYIILVGGDWMPVFRFSASLQPFIFLLVDLGVCGLLAVASRGDVVESAESEDDLPASRRPGEGRRVALFAIALFAIVAVPDRFFTLKASQQHIFNIRAFWSTHAGGIAQWFIDEEAARGREAIYGVIAMGDIGEIGYRTRLPIFDTLGLVEPTIAELQGGYGAKIGPEFLDYLFERSPRYVILASAREKCHHPTVPGAIAMFTDRRFRKAYRLRKQVVKWCVFERRDLIPADAPLVPEPRLPK